MSIAHYESVVIINASLEDAQVEQTIANIQESITTNGGEITDTENWGRKRLAYNINKAKTGYYLITRFTAPTEAIKKFERALRLDENVIRYMTIVLSKKDLEHLEKIKKSEEQKAQATVKEEEITKTDD